MKKPKIKIQIDKDVAEILARMKGLGETYSDVIKKLLNKTYSSQIQNKLGISVKDLSDLFINE